MPTQEDKSNKLREEVFRRYETLPPELKQAMASAATAEAIYAIAKKFGLNIEKTGYLADSIGYTILGIFPVADFVRNLKNSLEVNGAKAEEIAREVNAKIFLAIREQLKKTHGEKWDERGFHEQQIHEQPRTADTNSREQQSEQPRTAPMPQTPTTPKSPWEIKPDGFAQETRDKRQETWRKSVIPLTKETRDKRQETMPPELPKTREAPQPAPVTKGVEVLKEIRPTGLHEQPQTAIRTNANSVISQQKTGTTPPIGLPIMKEAEKLMQTPELSKPTTDNLQQTMPPQPKPITNNQQPTAPQVKPATDNLQPVTPTTPTPKYNPDPYREPIE